MRLKNLWQRTYDAEQKNTTGELPLLSLLFFLFFLFFLVRLLGRDGLLWFFFLFFFVLFFILFFILLLSLVFGVVVALHEGLFFGRNLVRLDFIFSHLL